MKQITLRVTLLSSLLLLCAVSVLAESPGKSAVGNWKLDLSKSSYGKGPAPKFEKLNILTDTPTAVKWTLTGVTTDGKAFTVRYDGPVDGQFHALMSNEGGMVAYKRSGGNLSWTVKDKNGNIVESAYGQLSPDRDTLTLKGTLTSPQGSNDFVSVFTRMQ